MVNPLRRGPVPLWVYLARTMRDGRWYTRSTLWKLARACPWHRFEYNAVKSCTVRMVKIGRWEKGRNPGWCGHNRASGPVACEFVYRLTADGAALADQLEKIAAAEAAAELLR